MGCRQASLGTLVPRTLTKFTCIDDTEPPAVEASGGDDSGVDDELPVTKAGDDDGQGDGGPSSEILSCDIYNASWRGKTLLEFAEHFGACNNLFKLRDFLFCA